MINVFLVNKNYNLDDESSLIHQFSTGVQNIIIPPWQIWWISFTEISY